MSDKKEQLVVQCPVCKEKIELSVADAEKKMSARCSKGHEVPLVKLL